MKVELPIRKHPRLENYDYSQKGVYFITFCVKDKQNLLGDVGIWDAPLRVPVVELSEYGEFISKQVQKINTVYPHVIVDKYIIMPNHVHILINVIDGTRRGAYPTKATIPQIVQSIKSMTTKQFGTSIWQRSYHDHIIRNHDEYLRIWKYTDENPALWSDDIYFVQN